MPIVPIPPSVQPVVSPIAPTENATKKTNHAKTDSKRAVEDSNKGRGSRHYNPKDDEYRDDNLGQQIDLEA
ncbi:hypothetical protein [Kiloniella sp. b19]|uniref:hypothetical protein n=1 Tax=Kiloniella sp. GXU_MW_B19 TaxID=3141326 RepID=UPI0031D03196